MFFWAFKPDEILEKNITWKSGGLVAAIIMTEREHAVYDSIDWFIVSEVKTLGVIHFYDLAARDLWGSRVSSRSLFF